TTFGVGMMIRDAVEKGCRKIILGLGGSCTNDAATGLAAAVGVKFFNEDGQSFIPVGRNLQEIKDLDLSSAQELLQDCQITAICDIDNPMYGQKGAAYVFAPQKGADKQMVKLLDDNLHYLADLLIEKLAIDVADLPDTIDFDDLAEGADLIFTGEGKIDGQSLRGKVVIGIAQRAIKKHIPVIALVGDIGDDAEAAYQMGVTAIFSINQQAIPFSEARLRSKRDLASTVDSLLRYWQIAYK
ncbi:MAG: glycerate kinase, partial [Clostridiales bacterium]